MDILESKRREILEIIKSDISENFTEEDYEMLRTAKNPWDIINLFTHCGYCDYTLWGKNVTLGELNDMVKQIVDNILANKEGE